MRSASAGAIDTGRSARVKSAIREQQLCKLAIFSPVFHFSNALRAVDPIADAMLGGRVMVAASAGVCPYRRGTNCRVHRIVGGIVVAAAVADFILSMVHAVQPRVLRPPGRCVAPQCARVLAST
jgi:hypothetical protein